MFPGPCLHSCHVCSFTDEAFTGCMSGAFLGYSAHFRSKPRVMRRPVARQRDNNIALTCTLRLPPHISCVAPLWLPAEGCTVTLAPYSRSPVRSWCEDGSLHPGCCYAARAQDKADRAPETGGETHAGTNCKSRLVTTTRDLPPIATEGICLAFAKSRSRPKLMRETLTAVTTASRAQVWLWVRHAPRR